MRHTTQDHYDFNWQDDDKAAEPASSTAPSDPADVAVALLLDHVLVDGLLSREEVGADGTVSVVITPDTAWSEAVLEHWKAAVRRGRGSDGSSRFWREQYESWTYWITKEREQTKGEVAEAADVFSRAVAAGSHCLGVAHDLAVLPPDLVDAADHTLTLPFLSPGDVAAVADAMCGSEPSEALSDAEAAVLTPYLLRLARRPGQSSDAFVRKLKGLLASRAAREKLAGKPVAVSPRAEPTLVRLHGMDEAVRWGEDLARDLSDYRAGRLGWIDVDRGCLLSGPPGTGKTTFARALARTAGVPLVTGTYGAWLGTGTGHQGDLLRSMRRTFREARDHAPSILFIDEVDAFANRSQVTHYPEWHREVVGTLLAEIDGVVDREGVVVIGACNDATLLDPALVRSGRLDRHIHIGLPDTQSLALILREHLGSDLEGADLSSVALLAVGSTGAEIERHVRGARRLARSEGRPVVMGDLVAEIGGDPMGDGERLRYAIHEAAHAVASVVLHVGKLDGVTLRGNRSEGGRAVIKRAGIVDNEATLKRAMACVLAGRAVEETILGEACMGAGGAEDSDLAQASLIATHLVCAFGYSEQGVAWCGFPRSGELADFLASRPHIEVQVQARVEKAYAAALAVVGEHRRAILAVAEILVQRSAASAAEVEYAVQVCADGEERM